MFRLTFLACAAACLTLFASATTVEAQLVPPISPYYYGSSGFWDNDYNPYGAVYGRGIRKTPRGYQSYRPYYGRYYTDRWYR